MTTDARYTPFRLERDDGTLVVRVSADGVPEFGPGVTAENVWAIIAAALPGPQPYPAFVDRGDYLHMLLPSVWSPLEGTSEVVHFWDEVPDNLITSMTGVLVTLPPADGVGSPEV